MAMKNYFNWIKHIFHMVYHYTEGFLLVVLTILLVTDVLLGILARFIHFEVVFATELGKYIFIWLCAIGISAAAKDNQHVRMSFIVEKLGIDRKVTWILSQTLFLIFSSDKSGLPSSPENPLMPFIGVRISCDIL